MYHEYKSQFYMVLVRPSDELIKIEGQIENESFSKSVHFFV